MDYLSKLNNGKGKPQMDEMFSRGGHYTGRADCMKNYKGLGRYSKVKVL